VDRVLTIRSYTIHEITLSHTKEQEIRVFGQSPRIQGFRFALRFPSAQKGVRLHKKSEGLAHRNFLLPGGWSFITSLSKNFAKPSDIRT
jgi:hypothetical protein